MPETPDAVRFATASAARNRASLRVGVRRTCPGDDPAAAMGAGGRRRYTRDDGTPL